MTLTAAARLARIPADAPRAARTPVRGPQGTPPPFRVPTRLPRPQIAAKTARRDPADRARRRILRYRTLLAAAPKATALRAGAPDPGHIERVVVLLDALADLSRVLAVETDGMAGDPAATRSTVAPGVVALLAAATRDPAPDTGRRTAAL